MKRRSSKPRATPPRSAGCSAAGSNRWAPCRFLPRNEPNCSNSGCLRRSCPSSPAGYRGSSTRSAQPSLAAARIQVHAPAVAGRYAPLCFFNPPLRVCAAAARIYVGYAKTTGPCRAKRGTARTVFMSSHFTAARPKAGIFSPCSFSLYLDPGSSPG